MGSNLAEDRVNLIEIYFRAQEDDLKSHDKPVEDSFDILHLLAKLLDHGLERQPDARQLDIG